MLKLRILQQIVVLLFIAGECDDAAGLSLVEQPTQQQPAGGSGATGDQDGAVASSRRQPSAWCS